MPDIEITVSIANYRILESSSALKEPESTWNYPTPMVSRIDQMTSLDFVI